MLNLVREGEEDYIEAIRYRRRLKSFENFSFVFPFVGQLLEHPVWTPSATSGPLILQVLRKI